MPILDRGVIFQWLCYILQKAHQELQHSLLVLVTVWGEISLSELLRLNKLSCWSSRKCPKLQPSLWQIMIVFEVEVGVSKIGTGAILSKDGWLIAFRDKLDQIKYSTYDLGYYMVVAAPRWILYGGWSLQILTSVSFTKRLLFIWIMGLIDNWCCGSWVGHTKWSAFLQEYIDELWQSGMCSILQPWDCGIKSRCQ